MLVIQLARILPTLHLIIEQVLHPLPVQQMHTYLVVRRLIIVIILDFTLTYLKTILVDGLLLMVLGIIP